MKSGIAAAFGMLAAVVCSVAPVKLVKDGRSAAQIVAPELADAAEAFAAHEIQKWVGEMTGAFLPVEKPSAAAKGAATVYVGAAFARRRFPEDFKAIGATDGFAVRSAEARALDISTQR